MDFRKWFYVPTANNPADRFEGADFINDLHEFRNVIRAFTQIKKF